MPDFLDKREPTTKRQLTSRTGAQVMGGEPMSTGEGDKIEALLSGISLLLGGIVGPGRMAMEAGKFAAVSPLMGLLRKNLQKRQAIGKNIQPSTLSGNRANVNHPAFDPGDFIGSPQVGVRPQVPGATSERAPLMLKGEPLRNPRTGKTVTLADLI
mgnify:CR=1 FL=1